MSEYFRGDVVIANVRIDGRNERKMRPVVVLGRGGFSGSVYACPITSREPFDSSYVPIGLDDFEKGGLDLFDESYVLLSHACTIRNSDVAGKRGKLTKESLKVIESRL
ncbi:type II toxin-antitoxin system PemK/MazF family toxin [Methanoplanus sp. FWC-SCC4]|uniref:Type II toxin-antitoxin system PemK/MazF family toxin n=1 Tax=Methanochimaera problematica TaxID=2609417 RepID=A0AA97FC76_9EURY|nr:type II toxin-antitoxin system PemK/MazF family toxin [Methanoplanus sp. FWC-SCC4]WOF16745.1 type II toxin-antitoxin system PemK/MazF family toxin [Methanoplanus sp. FWC-SCC4]